MNIVIVFHSVCGNTYQTAQAFERALTISGNQVILRRVDDHDWIEKPDITDDARLVLAEMQKVAVATPDDLIQADLILMGSPVYFGNVSAEIKAFMDSTGALWFQGKLTGKYFAAFVSAGNSEGGGDLALSAMHLYAKYMGMLGVPLPVTVMSGHNGSALGVIQYSNGKIAVNVDDKTNQLIASWSRIILSYANPRTT